MHIVTWPLDPSSDSGKVGEYLWVGCMVVQFGYGPEPLDLH